MARVLGSRPATSPCDLLSTAASTHLARPVHGWPKALAPARWHDSVWHAAAVGGICIVVVFCDDASVVVFFCVSVSSLGVRATLQAVVAVVVVVAPLAEAGTTVGPYLPLQWNSRKLA